MTSDNISYKTTTVLRFLNTKDHDLQDKTEKYSFLKQDALENKVYPYRINFLERDHSKALVQTEDGEERWVIDCATNDYLRMNDKPEVIRTVVEAIKLYGIGAQGASMLNGNTPIHFELEQILANFLRKEAAILSSSGYTSQLAATQGLLRPSDVVFFDHHSHSSLVDGMRLSGATMYQFPHRDTKALGKLLQDYRHKFRGAMIVTDGVFSTNGSIAPVAELVELARSHNVVLLVDDAHGIGTINDGKGCSIYDGIDLITGTLSKSLGSAGGFICGSEKLIDYLRFFGTANCSTTNISVANTAASLQVLKIIKEAPEVVGWLQEKVGYLRQQLYRNGIETVDSPAPIVSLVCGKDRYAYEAWRKVFDAGILVHALPFPIVPHGEAGLRIRINTALEKADLDTVVNVITDVSKSFNKMTTKKAIYVEAMDNLGFQSASIDTPMGSVVVHRKGHGKPVIFLHSLLFGAEIYNEVFKRIKNSEDFEFIAIDWWGHGMAPATDKAVTLEKMSSILSQIIREINYERTPLSLVGTSMGGMVALRCALDPDVVIENLLVIGASADKEEECSKNIFSALADVASSLGGKSIVKDISMTMFSANFMNEHPVLVTAYEEYLLRRPVTDYIPCVNAVLNRDCILEKISAIKAKTTIIVGDEDIAEPVPHSVILSEHIVNSNFKVISNAGHLVPLENPDEILLILQSWLSH